MIRESDLELMQVVGLTDNVRVVNANGESRSTAVSNLAQTIVENYEGLEVDGEYKTITEVIGDLKREADGTDSDLGELSETVRGVSQDLGSLSSDVSNIQGDVGTLQSDVGSMQPYVESLQTNMKDYVIEEKTTAPNGEWTYRKWASGRVECWLSAVETGTWAPWGSLYTHDFLPQPLPFTFLTYNHFAGAKCEGVNSFCGINANGGTGTQTPGITIGRGAATPSGTYQFIAWFYTVGTIAENS